MPAEGLGPPTNVYETACAAKTGGRHPEPKSQPIDFVDFAVSPPEIEHGPQFGAPRRRTGRTAGSINQATGARRISMRWPIARDGDCHDRLKRPRSVPVPPSTASGFAVGLLRARSTALVPPRRSRRRTPMDPPPAGSLAQSKGEQTPPDDWSCVSSQRSRGGAEAAPGEGKR
jgi:hypothetical protein